TLTIREGQQILEAHEKYGGTLQVGTQQRTEFNGMFARAAAMIRENRVGDLDQLHICLGGSRVCDALPEIDPPKHLNWDRWLGQAPVVPYRSANDVVDTQGWGAGFPFSRTHRYYRWFYEYSGGKLTDWGAHHLDIALWGMNKLGRDIGEISIDPLEVVHPVEFDERGWPTADDRFNCASEFNVKCTFADGVVMNVRHRADDLGFDNGIMVTGKDRRRFLVNRGKLVGSPVEELEQQPLADDAISSLFVDDPTTLDGFGSGGFHMANFMDCIKTGRTPASDMESHHRMLNVCHAINVALRLGREVVYDPATETFGDDELANSFIEREQRAGYETSV
ncbi:MAG: gfo/Idh/MocA family oxidoreductase, partial [Planctomycetota bacterium]